MKNFGINMETRIEVGLKKYSKIKDVTYSSKDV